MRPDRMFALLLLPLAMGALRAGGQEDPATAPETTRVKAELAQLKGHEWAGEYYQGDGLGVNVSLLVAPKSGFVYWWRGCLGIYDTNFGAVQVMGRRLNLLCQRPNRRDGLFKGNSPELILVRWGARHYLIAPDEMVEFANTINAGYEPRKEMHGQFLLRRGDERKAVRGAPDIAEEYGSFLLRAPITAGISAVGQSRIDKVEWCPSGSSRTTPVTLNAGSAKGVKVGMKFYTSFLAPYVDPMRVTEIDDASSETVAIQCAEDPPPSVDWRLSTRRAP